MKVNTLRQYWKDSRSFDQMLRSKMLLTPKPEEREDKAIWNGFQYKFQLTFQLYNYYDFFKRILYRVTRDFMNENVMIIEYRHIFGCLFDDDGNTLSLDDELAIFHEVVRTI